jgi:hypothetical protein
MATIETRYGVVPGTPPHQPYISKITCVRCNKPYLAAVCCLKTRKQFGRVRGGLSNAWRGDIGGIGRPYRKQWTELVEVDTADARASTHARGGVSPICKQPTECQSSRGPPDSQPIRSSRCSARSRMGTASYCRTRIWHEFLDEYNLLDNWHDRSGSNRASELRTTSFSTWRAACLLQLPHPR